MLYRLIKAGLPLILAICLAQCAGIQTDPTCKEMQFGKIIFTNGTDEYKTIRIFRVVHDGERYKTVGDPIQRMLEPMIEAHIRVSPGMVLVIIDKINGQTWMKALIIDLCKTTRINLRAPVAFQDILGNTPINPRRECGACPPCPIKPWLTDPRKQ